MNDKRIVLQNISGAIKWLGIRGIDNTDLLLVFLFEQRTRKYYLVTMRDNGETINVVYEHFIYVERVVELTQSFVIKGNHISPEIFYFLSIFSALNFLCFFRQFL